MRIGLDRQLDKLNQNMIEMGALCENAIEESYKGLNSDSKEQFEKVQLLSESIDSKERAIESMCLKTLLRQHPVAHDLFSISAALKMVTDMKRIGNQAFDISEIIVRETIFDDGYKELLGDMAVHTIHMVRMCVDAYVRKDLKIADEVIEYDDIVDSYFDKVKSRLKQDKVLDDKDGEQIIDLLLVAKYFERIGDHAVNIAKWVFFSMTGEKYTKENE